MGELERTAEGDSWKGQLVGSWEGTYREDSWTGQLEETAGADSWIVQLKWTTEGEF